MARPTSAHDSLISILSGADTSLRGRALRTTAAIAEPFYAAMMIARNAAFASGILRSTQLPRPTISVGNITTGGTGKTPVVIWLAAKLRDAGQHPAVLMRGYRLKAAGFSDEQQVLQRALPAISIEANPNRVRGAAAVLSQRSDLTIFILDDGFQHRRVRREFDLVLINATAPFGFGHVLPRGLLREPLVGLGRASAFIITRASFAGENQLNMIRAELARRNPTAPIYHSDHIHTALWSPAKKLRDSIDALRNERLYSVCGIGDPSAFGTQVSTLTSQHVGHRTFADHHAYTSADVERIIADAQAVDATRIVTTEKDWVKLATIESANRAQPEFAVLELGIRFHNDDESRLLAQVQSTIAKTTGAKKGCTVEG
jgi:tetraacyldisaccharide 4'-kinase